MPLPSPGPVPVNAVPRRLLNNMAALDADELDEPWAKGARTRIRASLFKHITADTNR